MWRRKESYWANDAAPKISFAFWMAAAAET